MGSRVISLTAYQERRLESAREEPKRGPVPIRLKRASQIRLTTTRQRLVGTQVDSVERLVIDAQFPLTKTGTRQWDNRTILIALFFLGCLVMAGLGL